MRDDCPRRVCVFKSLLIAQVVLLPLIIEVNDVVPRALNLALVSYRFDSVKMEFEHTNFRPKIGTYQKHKTFLLVCSMMQEYVSHTSNAKGSGNI